MAEQAQQNNKFQVGANVSSIRFGTCPTFDGTIVAKFDEEVMADSRKIKVGGYYHVLDEHGSLWHRDDYELTERK